MIKMPKITLTRTINIFEDSLRDLLSKKKIFFIFSLTYSTSNNRAIVLFLPYQNGHKTFFEFFLSF